MANLGNTGQRYKLRKFAKVEPQEMLYTEKTRFLVTLECGHSYIVLDASLGWYEEQIAKGRKTRCNDCPVKSEGMGTLYYGYEEMACGLQQIGT